MKQYVACEVRILMMTAEEIVRTSPTDASKDHFGDEWWTNFTGGQLV